MAEQRHETSEFDRGRIVGAHDAGMSEREIVKMYGFTKSTVHRTIKSFEENGLMAPCPRSGRPTILDDRDRCHLTQIVTKDHYTSLNEITAQMEDMTLNNLSTSTI